MEKQFDSFLEMFDFFRDKQNCITYFTQQRWTNGVTCPHCNSSKIYTLNNGGYKCANNQCYKKFNCFTKTIFENSKISLRLWFTAIYFLTTNTYGISSHELARKLKIRQATAWFMLHRIREFLKEKDTEKITGTVQLDEAAVGGKNKNRHKDKKVANSQGRSLKDKTWVFGIVKNDETYARVFVVPDTEMTTLMPIIKDNVDKSSIIVSDGLTSYNGLEDYCERHVKVKVDGKYKSEEGYHTNRMEGLWTQLKRMYCGTYHYMSPKHLQRYCDELAYKYNNKSSDDCITFEEAVSKIDDKTRLKYRDLVGYGKKRIKKEISRESHEMFRLGAEFRAKISTGL